MFCYILIDLPYLLIHCCKMANFIPTFDGMEYFRFNKEFETYIEVILFDKLALTAKERNRAILINWGCLHHDYRLNRME